MLGRERPNTEVVSEVHLFRRRRAGTVYNIDKGIPFKCPLSKKAHAAKEFKMWQLWLACLAHMARLKRAKMRHSNRG